MAIIKSTRFLQIVGAFFSVILNIIFAYFWRADGGTAVIIITEFMVCFMRIYLIRKEVNLQQLMHEQLKYIVAFVLTVLICMNIKVSLASLFATMVINSVIVTVIYILILLVLRTRMISDVKQHKALFLRKKEKLND